MNKAGRKSGGNRWTQVDPWDRLMAKCEQGDLHTDGTRCWVLREKGNNSGYGSFWLGGEHMTAQRAAWILHHGEQIPEGLEIDHLCKNRRCVNPLHLEAVTHQTNLSRGSRAQQTHCKRGHEFTPENTRRSKRGERICRTCAAAREWGRRHGYNTDLVLLLDPRSPTAPVTVYPYSGCCARCLRDRDDLFWHNEDRKFYCADILRCEARYIIQGEREEQLSRHTNVDDVARHMALIEAGEV